MWHHLSLPCSRSLKQAGAPEAAFPGKQRGATPDPACCQGVAGGAAKVFWGIWELRQFPALFLWLCPQFATIAAAAQGERPPLMLSDAA